MRWRDFIIAVAGSAVAWPLAARAQQPATPVVGFLHGGSLAERANFIAAFRQGLKETGYVEGESVAIAYRWAEDQLDRLPQLVAELVRHQVVVLAAVGNAATLAAKAATTILLSSSSTKTRSGLVLSPASPGRAAT